jgi:hypothetical protein
MDWWIGGLVDWWIIGLLDWVGRVGLVGWGGFCLDFWLFFGALIWVY